MDTPTLKADVMLIVANTNNKVIAVRICLNHNRGVVKLQQPHARTTSGVSALVSGFESMSRHENDFACRYIDTLHNLMYTLSNCFAVCRRMEYQSGVCVAYNHTFFICIDSMILHTLYDTVTSCDAACMYLSLFELL
jgi:hypothetical protein